MWWAGAPTTSTSPRKPPSSAWGPKDGVLRGHALRRDGTIRDTVMYSMRSGEWPEAKAQLLYLLDKPRA